MYMHDKSENQICTYYDGILCNICWSTARLTKKTYCIEDTCNFVNFINTFLSLVM